MALNLRFSRSFIRDVNGGGGGGGSGGAAGGAEEAGVEHAADPQPEKAIGQHHASLGPFLSLIFPPSLRTFQPLTAPPRIWKQELGTPNL